MNDLDAELDLTTATTYLMDMTAFAGKLEQQLEDTRKERDDLLALLRQIEWCRGGYNYARWCPCCDGLQPVHKADCVLDATLHNATGEEAR